MNADHPNALVSNIDVQLARPAADTFWKDVWKRFRRNRVSMISLFVVVAFLMISLLAPWIAPYGPDEQFIDDQFGCPCPPSGKFWFGVDNLGRDQFSRVVYGAQISLKIAAIVVLGTLILGMFFGTLSGWFGGWFDNLLMRVTDVLIATPYIATALAFVTIFGRSVVVVAVFSIFRQFPLGARSQRALILQYKHADYVEAARAGGASTKRVLWNHLIPNTFPQTIAGLGQSVGVAILNESAYAFLNVGLNEPTPSWGLLLSGARTYATAPGTKFLFLIPTAAFVVTITAFLFVSEGLRDAADPKLRGA
jgi:peptide/nickel transport system permease protein